MSEDSQNKTVVGCECSNWRVYETAGLGGLVFPNIDSFYNKFEIVKERNPWLVLAKCRHCNQSYYVAIDDSIYDEFHFIRLTDNQTQEILVNDKWPDPLQIADENATWLGDEIGPDICSASGCKRKRVKHSTMCRLHHYESLLGRLWKAK